MNDDDREDTDDIEIEGSREDGVDANRDDEGRLRNGEDTALDTTELDSEEE